jgi:hypothetical protein
MLEEYKWKGYYCESYHTDIVKRPCTDIVGSNINSILMVHVIRSQQDLVVLSPVYVQCIFVGYPPSSINLCNIKKCYEITTRSFGELIFLLSCKPATHTPSPSHPLTITGTVIFISSRAIIFTYLGVTLNTYYRLFPGHWKDIEGKVRRTSEWTVDFLPLYIPISRGNTWPTNLQKTSCAVKIVGISILQIHFK